jgi:hypothetical protein
VTSNIEHKVQKIETTKRLVATITDRGAGADAGVRML